MYMSSLLRNLLGGKSRGDPEVLEAGGGVSTAINMLNLSVQAHPRRSDSRWPHLALSY